MAVLIGRGPDESTIAAALQSARSGNGSALIFVGPPGMGKTSLLAAARTLSADFQQLSACGIASEYTYGYSTLADLLGPFRPLQTDDDSAHDAALRSAVGWGPPAELGGAFQVATDALAVLSSAAQRRPVLLTIDDWQWVDRESQRVLEFLARRISHDRVVILVAERETPDRSSSLSLQRQHLRGLDRHECAALMAPVFFGETVLARLVDETGGNPGALIDIVQQLSSEQLRGSSPLPAVLPVGEEFGFVLAGRIPELSENARWALVLAAAAADSTAGPVVTALRQDGLDADAALSEAEAAGAIIVSAGTIAFARPMIRNALWHSTSGPQRRSAHAALARALADRPAQSLLHRSEAAIGFDEALAVEVQALAEREESGYGTASILFERAARLTSHPDAAADALANAVHDAVLGADVRRATTLAAELVDPLRAAPSASKALALFSLGVLEHNVGSVPNAAGLFASAAELASGALRVRALVELLHSQYRLGRGAQMTQTAENLSAAADLTDPAQKMLACYSQAAALAMSGDWAAAAPLGHQAIELLETVPELRDDPKYLVVALLAAGWAGDPELAVPYLDRRLDRARALGAIGVLPLALNMIAGAAMDLGRHQLAYACAGEVVELAGELGYVAELAEAQEMLAVQSAARGRHGEASDAMAQAHRLATVAGIIGSAVKIRLSESFCALCRGDFDSVSTILEQRLAADGGCLPRGDYPLSVAPDLIEAYLALGRNQEALELAERHESMHAATVVPRILADGWRIRGLVAPDPQTADEAFRWAHLAHERGVDPVSAARTRLLHGSRLRRDGHRLAAREQLRLAESAFSAMGWDAWTRRAKAELAATGMVVRRGASAGDTLSSQETRVALLIAKGQSNKEIAAALFLSPKTVEHHVSSVLRKRGLKSRAAVAADLS